MDLDWYHLFPLTSSESPHSEPLPDSPVISMDLRGWLESQVGFQLIFNWTSHFQSGPVDGLYIHYLSSELVLTGPQDPGS